MSAAGNLDDGGFSLVSEPAAKNSAPAAANDDGGFSLVSEPKEPYDFGKRLREGVEEGVHNVISTGEGMIGAGAEQARQIWEAPLDPGQAAPGPLHSLGTLGKGLEEAGDVAMRAMQSGFQVPAAMLRAEGQSLTDKIGPVAGFVPGATGEVLGSIPEGFIGDGAIPHAPEERAVVPRQETRVASHEAAPTEDGPLVTPPPAPAPAPEAVAGDIMAAGDIDQAIQTAQSAVTRPPLDVDAMGAEAKRQGAESPAPAAQPVLDDGGYIEVSPPRAAAADPHALQDVISARAPLPKEPSLFDAIRGLGGIQDDRGDVDQIMQDFKNPPLTRRVVNPNGRSPDSIRAALQEQGWFGPLPDRFGPQALETGSYPGDSLTDLYALMDREARGDKVYHPDSNIHPALAERAYLDQELTEAGVGAADSNKVAAQKLADFRAQRDADLLAYEQSRAVHEDADMASISHEDLLGLLGHGYEPIPPHEYEPGSDLGAEREEFGGSQASNPRPEDQHLGAREDAQNGGEPAGAGENGLAPQALTAEPGAAGLDQTVIPGTERSAVQLAAAREAVDRGRITADAVQKPADEGLFADRSAQPPDLFSDAVPAPDAPGTPELPPSPGSRAIALKGIEGTGEEKSRSVSPSQTYHVGEEAPQIEAATRLVEKDPAGAEAIAMRQKQAPAGVHPEFVFMALENKATREGNTDLIARLNQSRISEEATTMGQRVAAYRNRDPLSAVKHVQAVQGARAAAAEAVHGDIAKAKAKALQEVTQQVQQAKKTAAATRPRQSWESFIESITCAGE